jgi:hypothetical protein
MKIILALLIVFMLIGCNEDSPTGYKNSQSGEQFELQIGETISVDEGKFVFKFDSVPVDNRCPKGAVCRDTGDAVVVIKVLNSYFEFHTSQWPRGMIINEYHIELIYLSPKPWHPVEPNIYTAKFMAGRVIIGSIKK